MTREPDDLDALLRDARALLGRSVSGDDVGRLVVLFDEVERLRARADALLDEIATLHGEALRSHRLRG